MPSALLQLQPDSWQGQVLVQPSAKWQVVWQCCVCVAVLCVWQCCVCGSAESAAVRERGLGAAVRE